MFFTLGTTAFMLGQIVRGNREDFVYEASSPEAIREHASRADLPVTEIIPIADTVIVRDDPVAAA